jgi:hypothetical protein
MVNTPTDDEPSTAPASTAPVGVNPEVAGPEQRTDGHILKSATGRRSNIFSLGNRARLGQRVDCGELGRTRTIVNEDLRVVRRGNNGETDPLRSHVNDEQGITTRCRTDE